MVYFIVDFCSKAWCWLVQYVDKYVQGVTAQVKLWQTSCLESLTSWLSVWIWRVPYWWHLSNLNISCSCSEAQYSLQDHRWVYRHTKTATLDILYCTSRSMHSTSHIYRLLDPLEYGYHSAAGLLIPSQSFC